MSFLTEEQLMIQSVARRIAKEQVEPRAPQIDETDEFPFDLVKIMWENGFLHMSLPEEYGGIHANAMTMTLVVEELSRGYCSMGPILQSTNCVIRIIDAAGNEEQKKRFFSIMSEGPNLGAFCLTETNAGSDAHSLVTKARREGNEYILNGTKIFVTLNEVAALYVVFARTEDGGISAFVIEKDRPGVSFGKKERKMGLHGNNTGDLILENARIPVENRLGEEGYGWKILNGVGIAMRGWGCSSIAIGNAQAALDAAVEFSKIRQQFGKPIGEFQAIQFMLADMKIQIEAARALVHKCCQQMDEEGIMMSPDTLALAAMCKCFTTDVCMKVTTDAVQVFGGVGYCKDYPVERMMRDAKILQILEGTNQVQRMIVGKNLLRLKKISH
ncbi:MAG: acyl-CoA dehydrogenase family protein [Syntrophomonadaceae bacterium]|jgi:alkylation response protein AidB-like acyl-CoA dehydrogenase